jgi:hypothetical protein
MNSGMPSAPSRTWQVQLHRGEHLLRVVHGVDRVDEVGVGQRPDRGAGALAGDLSELLQRSRTH